MTTLTRSGYLAAAQSIAWASGQSLDSLTDNEWTSLSNEVDNSTNKYMMADLDITLGSAAFTGTDSGIEVYIVPSINDTNYADWTGDVTTDQQQNNIHFVGFVSTSATTAAQRLAVRDIELPNGKFKWGFRNRANVTLAASGNAVAWRPHAVAV